MAPDRDLYAALRVARSKRKAVGCVRHMVPSPYNVLFSLSLSKLLSRYLAFSTFFPSIYIHFPLKAEREVCTSKSNLACANTAFFFFTQQGSISRPSHLCTFFLKISLLWSFLHSSNMLMLMCTLHGQCRTCSTSHAVRPTSCTIPSSASSPSPFVLKKAHRRRDCLIQIKGRCEDSIVGSNEPKPVCCCNRRQVDTLTLPPTLI